ncbi:hypothetical protein [Peribacillus asahii]|uniref:hypothetical protein n=1 Tax=Peribacillus asahii TaxID=228899 RepID=UPI00207A6387|nr:hypothetical protein [Peribacillus asahii]USK60399.1 hypothetical protein LIT37_03340 [Peribacillus asahii]
MKNDNQEALTHELPTHRFYYSVTSMISDMHQNKRGQDLYAGLYSCINSYYEESLALLRATTKLFETTDEQEKNFETRYSAERTKIEKLLENDEDEEVYRIFSSRLLEGKINFYDNLDLERNLFSLGTIVQFLSSFESTLHSLYKNIIEVDNHLSKIENVCKRDKGIIKYLKYFEKTLITNTTPIIIGTSNFQKLHQWIGFRNNIVHNNNETTEQLKEVINQRNLNIGVRRSKFIFDESNIRELAGLCGIILDSLVEEIFRPYFINSGALIE